MGAYRNDTGKTLYVNADKSKVVHVNEDGTVPEEAAFVLAGPGSEVPQADAERLGLGDYAPAKGKAKAADKTEAKAGTAAETKAVAPQENK